MPARRSQPCGLAAVFAALEALTYREMLQLAELLQLQAEELVPHARASDFANLLVDAAESFHAAEAEE
jgi:hypothetical protein